MSDIKSITKKDITALEIRTNAISKQADFKITSQEKLKQANELLAKLKIVKKFIKERKDSIVKPLSLALKNARELFKPLEEKVNAAEYVLKSGVLAYSKQVSEAIEKQKTDIAQKVESGETSFDKASDQVARAEGKRAEFKIRKHREIEIIKAENIPQEYWVLDMVLLRKDVLGGKKVDGVKIIEREIALS